MYVYLFHHVHYSLMQLGKTVLSAREWNHFSNRNLSHATFVHGQPRLPYVWRMSKAFNNSSWCFGKIPLNDQTNNEVRRGIEWWNKQHLRDTVFYLVDRPDPLRGVSFVCFCGSDVINKSNIHPEKQNKIMQHLGLYSKIVCNRCSQL